jgi:hypothetical protein
MCFQSNLHVHRQQFFTDILKWLNDPQPESRVRSIVGVAGLGKSWFMTNLFFELRQRANFLPIWLDVSKERFYPHDVENILDLDRQFPDCFTEAGRQEWLQWNIGLARHKCASPIVYDDTVAFTNMFTELVRQLCHNCGSLPVLLVDGYEEISDESRIDFLLEKICATFYGGDCTRIVIARRDDLPLPHHILSWQEKITELPPLDENQRAEQIKNRDAAKQINSAEALQPFLTGNAFINASLHQRVTGRADPEVITTDIEHCLYAALERGGLLITQINLNLLLDLAKLPDSWTNRDLNEQAQTRLEDPAVETLFQAGFIKQIKDTSRYQLDPDLSVLLQRYQENQQQIGEAQNE